MSIFHSWKHTMPIPDVQLEALIALAAEKRVAGEKWQAVAEAVNRSVRTVQNWPKGHPEVWKKHFAKAEAHLMKDASSEAMHVLRKLMRSKREDVQQLAAQKILQLREARKKTAREIGHLPLSGPGGLLEQYPKNARGRNPQSKLFPVSSSTELST